MARRTSSSSWSRPATGRQIAALKAHGNYDGKYYSVGRASKTIGQSVRGASGGVAGRSVGSLTRRSAAQSPSAFLSQLLGVPDDLDSLLAAALDPAPTANPGRPDADLIVESVAISVAPDESKAAEPRIVFRTDVVRNERFTGEPTLEVRFVSNVAFGDAPPRPPQDFASGVQFGE